MAKTKEKEITIEDALLPIAEQPYEIPSNWCWVKHNGILDTSGGSQPPKSYFISEPKEGYVQLYQTRDYGENPIPVYIPNKYATKTTNEGDILLARYGGSLGKVFRAHDGAYNVALAKVIKLYPDLVDDEFLYNYYLSHFYQDFCVKASNGRSAQAGFNREDMDSIPFPLPPIEEQKRIVERIASMFSKLEEAKDKLTEVVESSADRIAAIIHSAMTGELTAEWRKQNNIDINTWVNKKLGEAGLLERGRSKHRPRNEPSLFGGEYPFIQTGDVAEAGLYITHHKQTLSEKGLEQSRMFPKGTLCITIAANIGDVAILSYDCCFPDSVVGFTPYDGVQSLYIYYMMSELQKEIEANAPAVAQKNINLKILNDIDISIPSIEEQNEIISILERMIQKEEAMKYVAESAIDSIYLMKKSILAKAFRGELGTNKPDEESATELLKQIMVEA